MRYVPLFAIFLLPWHPQVVYTAAPEVVTEEAEPLHVQQLALLVTLNALLTHESKPPVIIRHTQQPQILSHASSHQTGLWLAQVQGIRAGPVPSLI